MILQMAQMGQIGGKLSENDLVGLLERVNAQTQKTTKIKVSVDNKLLFWKLMIIYFLLFPIRINFVNILLSHKQLWYCILLREL